MTTQTNIVQVNVTVTRPPAPSQLQRTGAFISQGGTSTVAGTSTLITAPSDLTPILAGAITLTSLTWSGSVVTAVTAAPHPFVIGDVVTISGETPTGYNGTYTLASVADTTHFTYALVSNPGAQTVAGIVTDADVAELVAMITTFFAQGSNTGVYVLELGHGTNTVAVAALATYLTANPKRYYVYVVPRGWDAESTFVTLVGLYAANTSLVYFLVTATLSTYASFILKSVYMLIEAAGIPVTEFTIAFRAYWILSQNPSSTNQVPPSSYSYALGVTPYAITQSEKTTFQVANLNYIGTGAEGGISAFIDFYGALANGDPVNMWYAIDYAQINEQLSITNAVINGSNRQPPLYYNQAGINFLQNVGGQRLGNFISYGLLLGKVILTKYAQADFIARLNAGDFAGNCVLNAEPFNVYVAENPSDYSIGQYNGLTCAVVPQLGFKHIVFNLNVTLFA